MQHLRPVDRLVVDVVLDNMSDNYSSKPPHVSPEFNNVMAAGAKEISGSTLCCAQLGQDERQTELRAAQRAT